MVQQHINNINDRVVLLLQFYHKHQRLPLRGEIYQDINIGNIYHNLKQQLKDYHLARNVDHELSKKLTIIKAAESQRKTNETLELYNDWIRLIKKFYWYNRRLPYQYEKYEGKNIGIVCNNLKHLDKRSKLPKSVSKQIQKLGIHTYKTLTVVPVQKQIDIIKGFYKMKQRFPALRDTYNGFNVGYMCVRLRRKNKLNQLPEKFKQQLDEIGFIWKTKLTNQEWLDLLRRFQKKYQRFPLCKEKFQGYGIGYRCIFWRDKYKKGILDLQTIKQLNSMHYPWSILKSTQEMIGLIEEFHAIKGCCPHSAERYQGYSLGRACVYLRNKYYARTLERDLIKRLQKIKFFD